MLKLIQKLILISVMIIASVIFLIFTGHPSFTYLGATIDKHKTLETTPGPRFIFVGGSNLAFGLDSPLIERKTEIPVVNMGLQAGLGLKFMLDEIKPFIQQGDIVVISPEYHLFYRNFLNTNLLAYVLFPATIENMTDTIKYFPSSHYLMALSGIPEYIFNVVILSRLGQLKNLLFPSSAYIMPDSEIIYARNKFNHNGDLVSHLGRPSPIDVSSLPFFVDEQLVFDDSTLSLLNEFKIYAENHGADVFLTFPPMSDFHYQENKEQIEFSYQQIKQNVKIQLLSRPEENVLPITFFYDTIYHLNTEGRQLRTNKMIIDMSKIRGDSHQIIDLQTFSN